MLKLTNIRALAEKWFGVINKGTVNHRNLPVEPEQTEARSSLYIAMCHMMQFIKHGICAAAQIKVFLQPT